MDQGIDDEYAQALLVDSYIDRLLSDARPSVVADEGPELAATADTLHRAMVRFHPSFGFEERLAGRLRAETDRPGRQLIEAGRGLIIRFPAPVGGATTGWDRRSRGLVVSGVIASGVIASGVSLAGAALIAWRRSRADERIGRSA